MTALRRRLRGGDTLRIGGAILLAVAAVLAALLASDALAWRSTLDGGDAALVIPHGNVRWSPATHLGGLAGSLLGVGDDVALRKGITLFRQVEGSHEVLTNRLGVEGTRAQAERTLAGPAASTHPAMASQARTLLGILAYGAPAKGGRGLSQAQSALSDMSGAVTVDQSNAAAKFDLELLLRLTAAKGGQKAAGAGSFGRTGRQGASGGGPGSGY